MQWIIIFALNIFFIIFYRNYIKRIRKLPAQISLYNACFKFTYALFTIDFGILLFQYMFLLKYTSSKIILLIRFILYLLISYSVLRYCFIQTHSWPKNVAKLYLETLRYNHFVICVLFLFVELHCIIFYSAKIDVLMISSYISVLCTCFGKIAAECHNRIFEFLLISKESKER